MEGNILVKERTQTIKTK